MGDQRNLFGDPVAESRLLPRIATRSVEEAHGLLRERRRRLLSLARTVAYELGQRADGVTTQEVLSEMRRRDMFEEGDEKLDQRWVGALFAPREFRDDFLCIGVRIQKNESRNCHAAPRRVWRVRWGVKRGKCDDE